MLELQPVPLVEANALVAKYHRHHKHVAGHKFSIGCMGNGRLAGGKRWTGSRRPAADLYPAQMKYRYEKQI